RDRDGGRLRRHPGPAGPPVRCPGHAPTAVGGAGRARRRDAVDRRQLHRDRRTVRRRFPGAVVRGPIRRRHALGGGAGARSRGLAEVLDTTLVEYGDDLGPDVPHVALDLGDCMLALYPVPPTEETSRAIWGNHHERPRCVALALSVADQRVAELALHAEGVAV